MRASSTDDNPILASYRQRAESFLQEKEKFDRRVHRVSYARLVTFLAAVVCFLAGWLGEPFNFLWLLAGGVLLVVFLTLVWFDQWLVAESERLALLGLVNRQAAARMLRDWKGIPLRATETPSDAEALAGDLDLFGQASLFHLACLANTRMGIDRLRDWFVHPADSATLAERQAAVKDLAGALDSRQLLECRGLKVAADKSNPGPFLRWAEAEPWLARRPVLTWTARLLPVATLVCVVLGTMEILPRSAFMIPLMTTLMLGVAYRRPLHAIFGFVSTRYGQVGDYADLFHCISQTPVASAPLVHLQQQVSADGAEAWREIRRLGRLADLAVLRYSSMFHFVVQSITSWDFIVLTLLERWQRRNGRHVRQWFEVLSQWEALASLAALAHDNPTWTYPEIEDQATAERRVTAQSLGHPLIPDDRRVANDVTIGPPETFLMVTGSNMSGKSTLLRAIGTNVVLAQAGAPVCAKQLTMPPVLLATSMRIHDSLANGVSFYMAELRRLKQIVDAARTQRAESGRILLYLLDEILQGTNTAERQIAVRHVLTHLVEQGAIGAVSTHDLQLAVCPSLSSASHAVHFRETIHHESGRDEMTFDYTLREGLATTSNALKLLKMVGLNDD